MWNMVVGPSNRSSSSVVKLNWMFLSMLSMRLALFRAEYHVRDRLNFPGESMYRL